jgi:hypothetical protein
MAENMIENMEVNMTENMPEDVIDTITENMSKDITENIHKNANKPFLDKIPRKKRKLELLRDTTNYNPGHRRSISSVNNNSSIGLNNDNRVEDGIRMRRLMVALPRINKK